MPHRRRFRLARPEEALALDDPLAGPEDVVFGGPGQEFVPDSGQERAIAPGID